MVWSYVYLLLVTSAALGAAGVPEPLSPAPDSIVYMPHPHLQWKREADVTVETPHRIQIAADEAFGQVVCDDTVRVVSRFVPVKSLPAGKYWWRVRRGDGAWSAARAFDVREPDNRFTIKAGGDADALACVLQDAARRCPARVDFEPGPYAFASGGPKPLVNLENVHDLIIDGHGATLVLDGTLLSLTNCQRVTIQHLTVTSKRPGHTLVRIIGKDPGGGRLIVKPEPGYDADVGRYFEREGNGGSFLGCMDDKHPGRYIPGAGVSAKSAEIARWNDPPGAFAISPVKPATLELCPVDAVAVVTAYHWQWMQMNRTDQCTLSDITTIDLPGAFCGGTDNSAKSYLGCRVKRRSPNEYFGGHWTVDNGRIGPWIENCELECLADDGPALQSLRMTIARADGPDTVLLKDHWGNRELREGDRVAVVGPGFKGSATATVRRASPAPRSMRVQLDRPLAELAAAMRRDPSADWNGVLFYRESPANEDFVYRHNRHVGGRGHGVKFNGGRAWIADNHFENINGNAVVAGFTWQDGISGHSARDVLISGNTAIRCGWTPIEAGSTTGLGGTIVIRDNRIVETRDAAVRIKGCRGVSVCGNQFVSSTPPSRGAWILVEHSQDIQAEGNRHSDEVPETSGRR